MQFMKSEGALNILQFCLTVGMLLHTDSIACTWFAFKIFAVHMWYDHFEISLNSVFHFLFNQNPGEIYYIARAVIEFN